MEIKYCDNCGKKIPYCCTSRRISVYDGDFSKGYEIDLCDSCFLKFDKHIRRVVFKYSKVAKQ